MGAGNILDVAGAVANQWSHMVGTGDASSNLRLYANGELIGGPFTPGDYSPTATAGRIGGNCEGTGANFFRGLIDEVRIYNKTLSAAEVLQLYNGSKH